MLTHLFVFVAGLTALVLGADWLVRGASRVARAAGISSLVIGLTVVAFGTSAPEAAVTVGAALGGSSELALGNVVGSNIFNILLILGLTAMVAPLTVDSQLIRQEVPLMIALSLALIALLADALLSRTEALILLCLLVAYTLFLVVQARSGRAQMSDIGGDHEDIETGLSAWINRIPAPVLVVIGLGLLVLGGGWLVDAASAMAREFGVSDLIIGLTVVALGTSAPEAATSVAAVMRGERDMAIGNVVGSNMMNIMACLGAAGLVSENGLSAPPALLNFDIWVMLAAALICLPIIITGRRISRSEGFLLLAYFACYLIYTLLAATHHDALPAYSNAIWWIVVPLTVLILARGMVRHADTANG